LFFRVMRWGQALARLSHHRKAQTGSRGLSEAGEYLKANFTSYERYGATGLYRPLVAECLWWVPAPEQIPIDIGYLDWRFIQDVASCSNGILQGKWLVDGSGVSYTGNMTYTDAWPSAEGRAIMVCVPAR